MRTINQLLQKLSLRLIAAYQYLLSPWVGRQCRYYPTCSHYTADAIQFYGFWKGLLLGTKRLLRCHPFHAGGYDPVPIKKEDCNG